MRKFSNKILEGKLNPANNPRDSKFNMEDINLYFDDIFDDGYVPYFQMGLYVSPSFPKNSIYYKAKNPGDVEEDKKYFFKFNIVKDVDFIEEYYTSGGSPTSANTKEFLHEELKFMEMLVEVSDRLDSDGYTFLYKRIMVDVGKIGIEITISK